MSEIAFDFEEWCKLCAALDMPPDTTGALDAATKKILVYKEAFRSERNHKIAAFFEGVATEDIPDGYTFQKLCSELVHTEANWDMGGMREPLEFWAEAWPRIRARIPKPFRSLVWAVEFEDALRKQETP
jgi:hypothetical protein